MLRKWMLVSLVFALAVTYSVAGGADKWLHVKVEDDGEKVSVNIPLSVIESMLPMITVDALRDGKLHVDEIDEFDEFDGFDGIDLREIARALREAPDADFVTVQSNDESVRVSKEKGYIVVSVEDRGGRSSENVWVRMPLDVLDALVGGDPHELDLLAALEVLSEHEGEALVNVESDDANVRVWIDRESGS